MKRPRQAAVSSARSPRGPQRLSEPLWWLACVVMILGVGGGAWAYFMEDYRYVPILTSSMEPHVPKGSLVVTEPVHWRDLNPGDVIALSPPAPWARPDGTPTVHRVSDIRTRLGGATSMTTRGDANDGSDPWTINLTSGPRTYGKVVHVVPGAGDGIMLLRPLLPPLLATAAGAVLVWRTARWRVAARRATSRHGLV